MKKLLLIVVIPLIVTSFVTAQNVIPGTNFEGIQWNGTKPPDPQIAVGLNHIVLTVNNQIDIYNKSGGNLYQNTLSEWFSDISPSGDPFDPRIVFDNFSNRWIILALS